MLNNAEKVQVSDTTTDAQRTDVGNQKK